MTIRFPTLYRCARCAARLFDYAAGLTLALQIAIVLWGVFTRFMLNSASTWTEEAAGLLLIWLTMLGGAAAAFRREHLGLEYFAKKLHPDTYPLREAAVELIVIAFALSVFVVGGGALAFQTLAMEQLTPATRIRMGYVYAIVPIAGLGITLSGLDRLGNRLFTTPQDPNEALE